MTINQIQIATRLLRFAYFININFFYIIVYIILQYKRILYDEIKHIFMVTTKK